MCLGLSHFAVLFFRYLGQKKYTDLEGLLYDGAVLLFEHEQVVVVVYHVTMVAIGHGLLKKCWPLVLDCV